MDNVVGLLLNMFSFSQKFHLKIHNEKITSLVATTNSSYCLRIDSYCYKVVPIATGDTKLWNCIINCLKCGVFCCR